MDEDKYYFEKHIYSNSKYEFSHNYDKEIIEDILKIKKASKVLDLGCGEGGNSLKLFELGFNVTCVDISKTAIKEIKQKNSKIDVFQFDIEEYKIIENYDVVLLLGITHFLKDKLKIISNVQNKTNKTGINIIDSYKSEINLKEIYSNWEILKYEEYIDDDLNEMVYFVAKKG